MLESFFGSAAPMWATAPPSGFAPQTPIGLGNGPIGPPAFGPSTVALSAHNPILVGTEPFAGLTASSLLTAVAIRRGQPQGPATDSEIEDFIYDALELLPGASDIEVRCEGGRVTLAGSVQNKRVKHDAGEIAWAIPVLHDVQNNLTIASRRRSRGGARESEGVVNAPNRKQT